jgi:hypothetical protein
MYNRRKKGRAYCRLSFYRGEGGYDIIIDIYRVLILRQGSSYVHRCLNLLLGIVDSCDLEETAITKILICGAGSDTN